LVSIKDASGCGRLLARQRGRGTIGATAIWWHSHEQLLRKLTHISYTFASEVAARTNSWIVGKPEVLLHTKDVSQLPAAPVFGSGPLLIRSKLRSFNARATVLPDPGISTFPRQSKPCPPQGRCRDRSRIREDCLVG